MRPDPGDQPDRTSVLHFVTNFGVGGTERQFTNLIKNHDFGKFDLRVGCMRRAGAFLPEIEALGCPIVEYDVKSLRKPHAVRRQIDFFRYLRREQIQVVHSYGFYGNFFAVPPAKLARVPVVIASVRDIGAGWTPAQQWVQKWICRLADSIITNAEAVRTRLISDGHRPDKIAVVRNGIDLSRFSRASSSSALREEFSIPEDAALIGTVSRIERVKGLEYFIDAAAAISQRFARAWFIIIGDALPNPADQAYRGELEERARARGLAQRMIFAGYRDDVPDVLSELAVSVLPSLSEGLSNAVLESMAAGVPVVATEVGGTPEIVEDGVTGLLVPPEAASSLARAVERLLEDTDLSTTLAESGRRFVTRDFSLERMARATENHYVHLLEGKASGSLDRRRNR